MKTKTYLLFLPCLFAASPALAQSAQSAADLEEAAQSGDDIVVTANRDARPQSQVGQAVTVLDTETIERRQSVIVSDLLRQTPGVTVNRNGGPGGSTSVNIRGAESAQTVALVDGVKINDPSSPSGGFNFGSLLVGNIARIEVLRGAQSVLWGSQAIGGVVNVITRQPTDRLAINARAEGGWHNSGQGFANVSDRIGPVALSAGGGYYTTDGISSFAGGDERDGFHQYAANASANVTITDAVSVDLRGFYANGRNQIDGYASTPPFGLADTPEYNDSEQWVSYAGLNAALFDGKLKNRIGYAHTDTDRRNYNPATDSVTFDGSGRNDRVEYQGVLALADTIDATFGAEHEVSHFTSSSYGGPETVGRARIFSVYGQLAVTPIANLTLTGGVRHDDHNVFGGATTASASGVWSPNDGNTTVRASYSEGFKAPTLYQLQSQYGNAALTPERSQGWDAGVTQKALGGALEASATWFHRTSTDLIDFVSCVEPLTGICTDRPNGTYDNIDRARSQGLEASLKLRPTDTFTVSAAYTYLDAENRAAGDAAFGNRLPRRAEQSVTVNMDYRWAFGLATGATITAVGDSFDDAGNNRQLDGYALVDLRASLPVGHNVEVYGRVENVFDQHYQTIYRYGQPGRAAYAGVRLSY